MESFWRAWKPAGLALTVSTVALLSGCSVMLNGMPQLEIGMDAPRAVSDDGTIPVLLSGAPKTYASHCVLVNDTEVEHCVWVGGSVPTTFTFTGSEGYKVLSIWLRLADGTVLDRIDSARILVDRAPPEWTSGSITHTEFVANRSVSPVIYFTLNATDSFELAGYEYSLDTRAVLDGLPNVRDWQPVEDSPYIVTELALLSGQKIYVHMRAVDRAERRSVVVSSTGWTVIDGAYNPSFVSFSETSPAPESNPALRGSVHASVTQVKAYSAANCADASEIGFGSRAAFVGGGFPISVALNQSTSVYARAFMGSVSSNCEFMSDYVHDNVAPGLTIGAPTASSVGPGISTEFPLSFVSASSITLAAADVQLAVTGTAACATVNIAGTGNSRSVVVSGCSGVGTVRISINAGAAQDAAGNGTLAVGPSDAVSVLEAVPLEISALDAPAASSDVLYGTTVDLQFRVRNLNPVATSAFALQLTGAFYSAVTDTCGGSLAASSDCVVTVRFSSPGEGSFAGELQVNHAFAGASGTHESEISLAATGRARTETLAAVYPNNPKWLDYVKNATPAAGPYAQADVACTGTESGFFACIHGGEKRKLILTDFASCAGLTASDTLSAFDWECSVQGANVVWWMKGLKESKVLADLVTSDDWRANHLSVRHSGYVVAKSASAAWWTNAVDPLPDNSVIGSGAVSLATSGIFTLTATRGTDGYHLAANRIAIVAFPGAQLRWSGSAVANVTYNGGPGSNQRCLVCSASSDFHWFEGEFNGTAMTGSTHAQRLMTVSGMVHSIWRKFTAGYSTTESITLDNSSRHNLLYDIQLVRAASGLRVETNSGTNRFVKIRATHTNPAIYILSGANWVEDAQISNGNNGIYISSAGNYVTRVLTTNNTGAGITLLSGANNNTITHVTAAHNGGAGINVNTANNNTFANIVTYRNGGAGLQETTASGNVYAQITSAHNAGAGIGLTTSTGSVFSGNLRVGQNTGAACSVSGGTAPGLIDVTCSDDGANGSSSYTGSASSAVFRSADLSAAFVGALSSDEPQNTQDTAGVAAYAAITQWFRFDFSDRVWGRSTTPSGICNSGNCQIWDFRLSGPATLNPLADRTEDGVNLNDAFATGGVCPAAAALQGTDQMTVPNTFLLSAYEVGLDGIGDEDGLCESSEACVYAPNFGRYQGDGLPVAATCTGGSGTVTNVSWKVFASPVAP